MLQSGGAEHKICIVIAANCYTVIAMAPKFLKTLATEILWWSQYIITLYSHSAASCRLHLHTVPAYKISSPSNNWFSLCSRLPGCYLRPTDASHTGLWSLWIWCLWYLHFFTPTYVCSFQMIFFQINTAAWTCHWAGVQWGLVETFALILWNIPGIQYLIDCEALQLLGINTKCKMKQ